MWEEQEFIDPFDSSGKYFWLKIEQLGRYLFAKDEINKINYLSPRALDIGCANGYGAKLMKESSFEVVGLDINEDYIEEAKRGEEQGISFHLADFEQKINPDYGKFDFITAFETIEHLDNPDNLISFAWESLKEGGKIICSLPNCDYEYLDEEQKPTNSFHKRVYTKEEAVKLFEERGFKLIDILGQPYPNIFSKHEAKLAKKKRLMKNSADDMNFRQSDFIEYFAYLLAYPCRELIEKSYSYIYLFEKQFAK